MDALIFLVVCCALAAFVAAPLYRRTARTPAQAPTTDAARTAARKPTTDELEARREALTATLRELELDRASGLLDEADYERERAHLEAELLRVLEGLDAGSPSRSSD